jgi:hypothetical protein
LNIIDLNKVNKISYFKIKLSKSQTDILKLNKKSTKNKNTESNLNEKYRSINLNLLKSQINKYHINNHMILNNSYGLAYSDQINSNYNNKNNEISKISSNNNLKPNPKLINFLLDNSKSSIITELEACRKSPSILTSLSAPRASIDCYQLSESSSLVNDEMSKQMNNESCLNQQSTNYLTQNGSINSITPSSTADNFDKIIDDCVLCKEFTLNALNSSVFKHNNLLDDNNNNNNNNNNNSDFLQFFEEETSLNTELNRSFQKSKRIVIDQKPDYILKCFCFCCYEYLASSYFYLFLKEKRIQLKKLVDKELQRAILCAILINTLSMGIEHHDQVNNLFE